MNLKYDEAIGHDIREQLGKLAMQVSAEQLNGVEPDDAEMVVHVNAHNPMEMGYVIEAKCGDDTYYFLIDMHMERLEKVSRDKVVGVCCHK